MFEVGQMIEWKAAGKVARLEGKAGQIVLGRVVRVSEDGVTAMPVHRTLKGAVFPNLLAGIPLDKAKPWTDTVTELAVKCRRNKS